MATCHSPLGRLPLPPCQLASHGSLPLLPCQLTGHGRLPLPSWPPALPPPCATLNHARQGPLSCVHPLFLRHSHTQEGFKVATELLEKALGASFAIAAGPAAVMAAATAAEQRSQAPALCSWPAATGNHFAPFHRYGRALKTHAHTHNREHTLFLTDIHLRSVSQICLHTITNCRTDKHRIDPSHAPAHTESTHHMNPLTQHRPIISTLSHAQRCMRVRNDI